MKPSDIASNSPLGKHASYITTYSPSLLFPIPRAKSRETIALATPLPFHGIDMWTGYEISWLNMKGKPEVAIAEFHFPADSLNLVESKSFKLYLNSFNQSRFHSPEEVRKIMERDLGSAVGCAVNVEFSLPSQFSDKKIEHFTGICLDEMDIEIDAYEIDASLLIPNEKKLVTESLYSHLLKSNCLVTGQPDWADLFIRYQGPKIDRVGLLKYIISFRDHRGFHEQCVERIFCDLLEACKPEQLTVYARYTRRGGLDINPFRSNFERAPLNIRSARQ
jgi:7-cyano-7-deazaguanine reductase